MRKNKRICLMFVLLTTFVFIITLRLYHIQISKGEHLKQEAFLQKTGSFVEKIRGDILDRNGVSLTGSYPVNYSIISCDWLSLEEKKMLLDNNIIGSIEDNNIKSVKITPHNSELLHQLNGKTPGVFLYNKINRYGPDALATHVVGFQSETGIEKTFDDILESDMNEFYMINDGLGQPIAGLAIDKTKNYQWGVKLTIDKDIQATVEEIMDKRIKAGAVVVLDANSSEVLAMASRPNYKQFQLKDYLYDENAPLINRAIESYAPGSIFKTVILSAALEENLAELDEIFYCSGFEKVGVNTFKCSSFDNGGHGKITLKNAMAFSCNSVFIQLGLRLGEQNILKYAKLFGLGEKTLVSLPEEKEGNIPDNNEVFYQDLGNISIGQGAIGITPIQSAQIMLTVINDGVLKKPTIIKEIVDKDGNKVHQSPIGQNPVKILSEKTCRKVRESLEAATTYGTGQNANPQNQQPIGGKTGTAETAQNNSHAWFAGYYPSNNPELVISVLVEEGGSGSVVAAPVFKEIIDEVITLENY